MSTTTAPEPIVIPKQKPIVIPNEVRDLGVAGARSAADFDLSLEQRFSAAIIIGNKPRRQPPRSY